MMQTPFVALCAREHRQIAFVPDDDYSFAKQALTVPAGLDELPFIIRHYPVLFMGEKTLCPVAILGLDGRANGFLDPAGRWLRDHYIPSVLRLHPFALHEISGQDSGILLFDRTSRRISARAQPSGEAGRLFDDGGEPTELLRNIAAAQLRLHEDRQKAAQFGSLLHEAGLLVQSNLTFSQAPEAGGSSLRLHAIDKQAYRALAPGLVEQWFREGWLDAVSLIVQAQRIWTQRLASRQAAGNGTAG